MSKSTKYFRWMPVALMAILSASGVALDGFLSDVCADDRDDVLAAVESYHLALADGDSAGAVALLAEDVLVQEGGHVETLAEYLSHHLGADMEFAAAVPSQREVLTAMVSGDVAWVASSSMMKGTFRGREIRARGAELMVLTRDSGDWKIRAIHWSNR